MNYKPRCIYCGVEDDLSESDIIPDALTNARITNKNVCKIKHNNNFSDLFESKVIKSLAFICNELDVKSKKGKNYAQYEAKVDIAGVEYDVTMTSQMDLFNGRVLKSTDKKHLMSSIEKISRIANDPNEIESIDINNIIMEKKVAIDLSIYFDEEMFRLIAKIAFEWYCAKNNVIGYYENFREIISFITEGVGTNPVSIIQNEELYSFISNQVNMGSHVLIAFEDNEHRINVIVSLFGIAMYRVIVSNTCPEFCKNNLLYQELCTDSSRKEIIEPSLQDAENTYLQVLMDKAKFSPVKMKNGFTCMFPTQRLETDVLLYMFVCEVVNVSKKIRDEAPIPNDRIVDIIRDNIYQVISTSLLHKKSIKRFVKEHFKEGNEPIKLNPTSSNKKSVFMFYILMVIAKKNIKTIDNSTLQELTKEALCTEGMNEIKLDDDLEEKMKNEILNTPNYSTLLEQGAYVINRWE